MRLGLSHLGIHTRRFGSGGGGAPAGMLMGMNLSSAATYNGGVAFANLLWQSTGWELESETSPGTTVWTQRHGLVTVTAVTGTAVFRRVIYDDSYKSLADYMPSGNYTLKNPSGYSVAMGTYGGSAFLPFSTTTTDRPFHYDSSLGVIAIHVQVTATGTYGTGLKVLLPNHDGSDYFNSQFLTFMQGFGNNGAAPIRFMDWEGTNNNVDTDWADRTLSTDPALDPGAGIPWEACFDLCNRLGRDPWVNIPARATSAYVTSLANLALSNLNAGRKLWVERGNEIWNQASVFFMGTQWVNYKNHPRYAATVDPTSGVITRVAHGLSNGETILPFATKTTVANGITGDSVNTNGNYYYAHRGIPCIVSDVTTNTFRIKDGVNYISFPSVRGDASFATNSVTDLIYVRVSDAGSTDLDANYVAQSVADWSALDAVLGSSRVGAIMGSQAANPGRTITRLGATGASRFNYVAGAPYYKGIWFHCAVDVASGQFTPRIWTTDFNGSGYVPSTIHYGVYAQGSTPFNYEIENATGTGFVAGSHQTWQAQLGSRIGAPVTISVATPGVVTLDTVAPTAGNTVVFSTTGALPTGLSAGTTYFVVNPSGNTFQVAATSGGTAITTTGAGSGTHTANVGYGASTYIPAPASTGMTNGTTYTHCFVVTDNAGYKWRLNADIAASVSASTSYVADSYNNQALRHLLYMHDTNMPNIAAHQAAIAASGNPAGKYIDYEFAPSNQDEELSAPAAALTWMRTAVKDLSNKAIEKLNLTKQAANGVYACCWFSSADTWSISWTTSGSYYDTTDPRYVGLTEFGGTVPAYTQLTQTDITASAITTTPSVPTIITALPADGSIYSVVKASPSVDQYDISGGNLRLLSNLGINYGVSGVQTIRLRKSDGRTDIFFNVKVNTGPAVFYESDALIAWNSIADTTNAAMNLDVGTTMTLAAGSGAVISGGMWDPQGTTQYTAGVNGLISGINFSKPIFAVVVLDRNSTAATESPIIQFGTFPTLIDFSAANSGTTVGVDVSYTTNSTGYGIPFATTGTKQAYWVFIDVPNSKVYYGANQTQSNTAGGVALPGDWGTPGTSGKNCFTGATHPKYGSFEVVNRTGMTLTDALAMVQKVQNLHGI